MERNALFAALADVGEPMNTRDRRRAWEMAIGLFAEIVTSVCLDPLGRPTRYLGRDLTQQSKKF